MNGKPSKSRLPMDPMNEREQGKEVELKNASEHVAENVCDWNRMVWRETRADTRYPKQGEQGRALETWLDHILGFNF